MKALEKLDYVERAKILHTLFPGEISGLIEFTLITAEKTLDAVPATHIESRMLVNSPEYKSYLARNVRRIISADKLLLTKDSKRFSEWLFRGYNALFMLHCLEQYATQLGKRKFSAAVLLLFGNDAEK